MSSQNGEDTMKPADVLARRGVSRPMNTLFSPFSPFLTISLCRAGQYFCHPVDLVPCLQSVGTSSCLPLRCPSISFSVNLCSFSQKPLVSAIPHRCGCVLASSSGQTTLVFFSRNVATGFTCASVVISDVVQPGLPSCPSQHLHFF